MSFEAVNVYVADQTNAPIEGVVVKVYSQNGAQVFTQATTDANGMVGFLLETQTYSLRFYKFQTSFVQPQLITVTVGQNTFDVVGTVFEPPVATDPRLCRCSGFFRDITGGPDRWVDIHIIGGFRPVLLEGSAILNERRSIRTDKNGYACIDLIRCAEYDVVVQGLEDYARRIRIPDTPNANLPDILFPVVGRVEFAPAGPFSVGIGAANEIVVTPTVFDSTGIQLEGSAPYDVQWSTEDPAIALVLPTPTTLTIRGLAAGTTTLLATRRDQTIVRIPSTPIEGVPVDIVVT